MSEMNPGSLEARVAERRRKLEQVTTELFDVPGFEGVFKVELQMLGGKRQFAIFKASEHVHDEYRQSVNIACDTILAATVAFHAVVNEESGETALAEDVTWRKLAMVYDKTLEEATLLKRGGGRIALSRLVSEADVIELVGEWKKWMQTRGQKVERDLEDF